MIIQVFIKFHDFSMYGTLFGDFPGFPWFPELVGTLFVAVKDMTGSEIRKKQKKKVLFRLKKCLEYKNFLCSRD